MFYPPLGGIITDKFNKKTRHFGVDLVAKEKSRISSVLEGTIIVSHWTSETGYVIGVQHKNDFISIYKHNSVLLKEVGDFVNCWRSYCNNWEFWRAFNWATFTF